MQKQAQKLPVGDGVGGKDEPFDRDKAWEQIRKTPYADGSKVGVNFVAFESWWKQKAGLSDPDIPVLPEFLVMRIEDKVRAAQAELPHTPARALHVQ